MLLKQKPTGGKLTMFCVGVREHIMIAHSFQGTTFGPAQRMHGATFVVDLELYRPELDSDGIVVDIGLLGDTLKSLLGTLNYRNLDEISEFRGKNTTTEFLARHIFDKMADHIKAGDLGSEGAGLTRMKVKLHESHIAWASYENDL
jgi:6-pyruvoyl-tetrahydropterin synthase